MEGWDPARGEKEQQEACMVKGAGEGKEQNRWGEETEWVTGGDSRISVTPKAQIPFAVLKTNHYFRYTIPSPHTHIVGWITVLVRQEWNSGEKTKL